jgi:hypothetical protein
VYVAGLTKKAGLAVYGYRFDIGGSQVKLRLSNQKSAREFDSSRAMTSRDMLISKKRSIDRFV